MFLVTSQALFAQKFYTTKKPSLIGFSANLTDFTASFPKIQKVDPGASIMYWKGITNLVDFSLRYNALFSDFASGPEYPNQNYTNEFEGALHLRPASDNHTLLPFLSAGLGIGNYPHWTPYAPLGGGLQLNLMDETYIFLQANYRKSFNTNYLHDNMFYSLGFTEPIGRRKEKVVEAPAVTPVQVVKDRDNDGVEDALDLCPDVAGLAKFNGCPDTDGDGIADKDDKCPAVAGLARYGGCPIPDSDNDGINDEQDKCPNVAGVARYQGCPIPDTDGDGVNDEMDKCPTLPGTVENHGCPEIKAEVRKRMDVAAKNIYFATGSAKLLAKSNKALNSIADVLKADPNLKLDINGYTDNTGKPEKNLLLSQNRAKAVYDYLVKKGISDNRLQATGFGQEDPIADNKTAAGRAKNRRVELKLHYD